ncbi:MAG: SPOR domain-containing protein [Draconibacterium sp.]|nr:SPOR domain-containing protein [Draconibacterium sp.]
MIGKYIHELILENETVIIPGFGAFISNYKPAELNEESDELNPPSKEVSFNQQIRNNDGLLVGSIADGESISHFDALKKIERERENIIFQLDKGEKVTLEETGELFYNDKNEIQFTPFEDENLFLDSFGLEAISLKENVEKKEEAELPKEIIVSEIDETPKEEPTVELGPGVVQELEKEIQEPEIQQTESPKEEPVPAQIYEDEPKNEERKKSSGWWLLLILAPIIIVGIYITNQKSKTKEQSTETNNESTLIIEEEPFLKADSIPVEVQDSTLTKEIEIDSTETTVSGSPEYYLVGGSFKEEQNAKNYLKQLKAEGFEPFDLGKRGNFYIVGIGTYKTELEAVLAKREFVKNNPDSGVWIMGEK